jgi:hypothetical protein
MSLKPEALAKANEWPGVSFACASGFKQLSFRGKLDFKERWLGEPCPFAADDELVRWIAASMISVGIHRYGFC